MKRSLCAVLILLVACAGPSRTDTAAEGPTPHGQTVLTILMGFLPGTWETLPAAEAPTRLRMAEFWQGKPNERWIYAEYERMAQEGRPFRQRLYRFSEAGGTVSARVYGLPENPARFAGEWRKAKPFEGLTPSQLREFKDCRMVFGRAHEALFTGGTEGNRCRGDRPGVAYERSEFFLSSSSLRNLEQGYDPAGRRVAGEASAYDLRRMSREARLVWFAWSTKNPRFIFRYIL